MNKIISIVVFIILSAAIVFLVLDNKKANDSINSYKGQIKTYQNKNDSILKIQDSLEYKIAQIHIELNNLSQTNDLLLIQYKNAKNEIDSLKKQGKKIDSSIFRLNCNQLSDILTKRYQ
jgi:chromosome segregation ATPase